MATNDAKIQGNRLESKMCNDYVNNPECLACRGRTCCIKSNCNDRTWHWSERAHVRYKTKPTSAARGCANTLKTKQLCKKSKGRWYIKKCTPKYYESGTMCQMQDTRGILKRGKCCKVSGAKRYGQESSV